MLETIKRKYKQFDDWYNKQSYEKQQWVVIGMLIACLPIISLMGVGLAVLVMTSAGADVRVTTNLICRNPVTDDIIDYKGFQTYYFEGNALILNMKDGSQVILVNPRCEAKRAPRQPK